MKYFIESGLAEKHKLKIQYFYDSVKIHSPRWEKGLVLIIYKNLAGWGADLRFYVGKEWVDMLYSLDSFPAFNKKGYYCSQCMERQYFSSLEALIYDELFKIVIEEIEELKYECGIEYGDGWARFIK